MVAAGLEAVIAQKEVDERAEAGLERGVAAEEGHEADIARAGGVAAPFAEHQPGFLAEGLEQRAVIRAQAETRALFAVAGEPVVPFAEGLHDALDGLLRPGSLAPQPVALPGRFEAGDAERGREAVGEEGFDRIGDDARREPPVEGGGGHPCDQRAGADPARLATAFHSRRLVSQ